jgi:uncharacterized membrane protein
MGKNRMEAFSDGVIAIIITIMVLELRPPKEPTLEALRPMVPVFLSYVLSFIYVAIYWNNHHHMLHTCGRVSAGILWANLFFLFWLSLFPFVTAWMGDAHGAPIPTAIYGAVLLMAGIGYLALQRAIISHEGPDSVLLAAVGSDWKGKLSAFGYVMAIAMAFVDTRISHAIYAAIALMWVIPDRRIERAVEQTRE